MGKYIYTVKDSAGKTISDTTEAISEDILIEQLQKQGYFIVSVKVFDGNLGEAPKPKSTTQAKSFFNLDLSMSLGGKPKEAKGNFTHKKCKDADKLSFATQLSMMLDSGITLLRSLIIIIPQIESEQLFDILTEIQKDVEGGSSLSESIAKYPKVFSQFWVSLIEVGEAAGTMPQILKKLCNYLEQASAFQKTVSSAMIYPMILFFVSMGAVVFFAFVVAPQFQEIFEGAGAELPGITSFMLTTFEIIKTKFHIIGGVGFGLFMLFKQYAKTPVGMLHVEKIAFSLPLVGKSNKLIIVERFTSQMAILIDSGVPILQALEISQKLVENKTCALIIADIQEEVRGGKLLAESMDRSKFFPPMCTSMIRVGEESGEISQMLKHVANFYQSIVETAMHNMATMIEPLMLVFMGGLIGTIVLAMFMPMFNMSSM